MANDENLDLVNKGQVARIVRNHSENWIMDTEEALMQHSVRKYKMGELTPVEALCIIAEISSLRSYREYLEVDIDKGVMAAEVELGQDG